MSNSAFDVNGIAGGGSGSVTSVAATAPITATPNPIVSSGTISLAMAGVTPGTYPNATITVDQFGLVQSASGSSSSVVHQVSFQTGAYAAGSTIIPVDDSIPQNTEGDEYMTLSITPSNIAHTLVITAWATVNVSSSSFMTMALFQDANVDALAATCDFNGVSVPNQIMLTYVMPAGTISATTFKIRMGGTSGSIYFNGLIGGRVYGGVSNSGMQIVEYS